MIKMIFLFMVKRAIIASASICIYFVLDFFAEMRISSQMKYRILLLETIFFWLPIEKCFTFVRYGDVQQTGILQSRSAAGILLSESRIRIIWMIWFLGCVIILTKNIIQYWSVRQKLEKSIKIRVQNEEDTDSSTAFSTSIYISNVVKQPMSMGIFHSKIFFHPTHLKEKNFSVILEHEYIHLKRHDSVVKLYLMLLMSFYWYHPLMYLYIKEIHRYMEYSCDEIVLEQFPDVSPKEYCMELLRKSVSCNLEKMQITNCFSSSKRSLKRRMEHIMAQKEKKLKRYPVFMCALIIAGSICAGLVIRDRVKVADSQLTNADIVIDNDGSEYTVTINNDMDFSSGDMQMLVSDIIGERVERDNITLVKKQK